MKIALFGIAGLLLGIAFVLAYAARVEPLSFIAVAFLVTFTGFAGLAVGIEWSRP